MHLTSRQQKILQLVQQRQQISVADLCRELYFSPSTIRRDLELLQQQELLLRTHGGAMLRSNWDSGVPSLLRETQEVAAKQRIGKAAVQFLRDGDRIFIDSSSTAYAMVDSLDPQLELTVFTNGLSLASKLSQFPKIKTICTGGQLIPSSQSFIGFHALRFLEYYYADKLFFSTNSFSLTMGITDMSEFESELKRQMILRAKQVFYLADSSKFETVSTYKICEASDIHTLITNAPASVFAQESELPFQIVSAE